MATRNVAVITERDVDTGWHHQAACNGDPSDDWLEDFITPHTEATCASCPVRDICLQTALREEGGGTRSGRGTIRGGLEPAERHELTMGRPIPPRVYGRDLSDVIQAAELTIPEAAAWAGTSVSAIRDALAAPDERLRARTWPTVLDMIARAIPGADHAPGNTKKGNHNA